MSGDLTRITVNLPPRGLAALAEVTTAAACGKADAVVRALLTLAYLLRRTAAGAVLKLHDPDGSVEAVTFL